MVIGDIHLELDGSFKCFPCLLIMILAIPIGPLRLDVASKDLSGDWRYTLGVGWKF